ncbi:MAG: hypothetical protein DWQ37_10425 [Planctomycetota bacterium]|nr:MAG: hypothetical protein DWQ37_10425 [Planctomycetota bacterium]
MVVDSTGAEDFTVVALAAADSTEVDSVAFAAARADSEAAGFIPAVSALPGAAASGPVDSAPAGRVDLVPAARAASRGQVGSIDREASIGVTLGTLIAAISATCAATWEISTAATSATCAAILET